MRTDGTATVYKEGEVLVSADVTENGTTFKYEKRRQSGAVYDVYAGADIKTAYGTKVYSKGDLVKENLTTDTNGATVLKKSVSWYIYCKRETGSDRIL